MTRFKVSRQGQELGAFTLPEIVAKVRAKEVELFDYIFDESKADWVLLMEYPALAQELKSTKPPKPPTASVEEAPKAKSTKTAPTPEPTIRMVPRSEHDVTDWFILKGEHRFGPFEYSNIIQMLQQKIVFPFDWIWHAGLEGWHRVTELAEFQPETIRQQMGKKKNPIFTQRQFERQKVTGRVFVHDNITLWKGESFEISQGGIGVTLENHLITPGQTVTVHMKRTGKLPAFNALCEVVSKKFEADKSKPIEYGFKFLSISHDAQDELRKKVA
jgi:hypothetical protein